MDVLVRKISQIFQEKYITDKANSKCFLKILINYNAELV